MATREPKQEHAFPLGSMVKDRFSGITGKVVAIIYHENGCVHYDVQPAEIKDGKLVPASVFDVQHLELVAARAEGAIEQRPVGGPSDMTPRGQATARQDFRRSS